MSADQDPIASLGRPPPMRTSGGRGIVFWWLVFVVGAVLLCFGWIVVLVHGRFLGGELANMVPWLRAEAIYALLLGGTALNFALFVVLSGQLSAAVHVRVYADRLVLVSERATASFDWEYVEWYSLRADLVVVHAGRLGRTAARLDEADTAALIALLDERGVPRRD